MSYFLYLLCFYFYYIYILIILISLFIIVILFIHFVELIFILDRLFLLFFIQHPKNIVFILHYYFCTFVFWRNQIHPMLYPNYFYLSSIILHLMNPNLRLILNDLRLEKDLFKQIFLLYKIGILLLIEVHML